MKSLEEIAAAMQGTLPPDHRDNCLLAAIKARLPDLEAAMGGSSGDEDAVYRFYHHSFKVYWLAQDHVLKMVELFRDIGRTAGVIVGDHDLNPGYLQIVKEGTGKKWVVEHNRRWLEETRPMVEALLHTDYFVRMMVKYGKSLDGAPNMLPSGWAAVLYLYGIR